MRSASRCRIVVIAAMVMPLMASASDVNAQPTVAMQYGRALRDGIERAEIGVSFPTPIGGRIGSAAMNLSVNVDLAEWHTKFPGESRSQLTDVGVTPHLRFLLPDRDRFQPYVDFGIGAHVLSGHDIDGRRLGGRFQFGDYIGVGARFGEQHRFAASVRLLHESNGGTHEMNSGLTAVGIRLEYALP